MESVCVFCGSSRGRREVYQAATRELALELVERDCTIVYGGAHRGLMGILADTALAAGGRVVGVIPQALGDREVAHGGLTALHTVSTLYRRKERMTELADGFVALPGGLGTLDELFEAMTWRQLGLHDKPVGLFNTDGFFDPLIAFLAHATREGYVPEGDVWHVAPTARDLLDRMAGSPRS